ncbi:MAG: FAD-dependent oxidoreductase [Desulfosarcinaceae bacterium]|jgi:NAD(P)H-nitrite reductase large subunit
MMRSRRAHLIIGAGAAGMVAAAAIREQDAAARITVVSAEADRPYFRPLIPFLISGRKDPAQMSLEGQGPFRTDGVEIKLDTPAAAIDTERQAVVLASGQELAYDRLLIATGSRPLVPEAVKKQPISGVYSLRTMADARSIVQRCQTARQVVMLGGGMLNVKTAFALLAAGLEVTLVEIEASVLPWLMEADAATLIHNALLKAGLKVITGATLRRLRYEPEGGIKRVELSSGETLACQMLLIGIGVQPNIALLKSTPLHCDQGVVVDPHCACSVNNIFAAGDVASRIDPVSGAVVKTGLWSHAVEMGRCAGLNMAGKVRVCDRPYGVLNATQVADVPFVSMGVVHTAGTDYEAHVCTSPYAYRKLIFSAQGDRLIGALFVGDITNAGLYRHFIYQRRPAANIKSHMIRHRLHYGHLLSRAA